MSRHFRIVNPRLDKYHNAIHDLYVDDQSIAFGVSYNVAMAYCVVNIGPYDRFSEPHMPKPISGNKLIANENATNAMYANRGVGGKKRIEFIS